MRPFALLLFTLLPAAFAQSPLPANDPYRLWAADSSRWGASVANESLRATLWGEAADPDRDKLTNLQEYAFGTDPKSYTGTGPVTWSTTISPGHFSLTYKARQNDPALLIVPQASSDLASWFPLPPVAVSAWAGDPGWLFTEASRSPTVGDYATLTQVCNAPIDSAARNFTRILILRGTTAAVTSPTDGLRFQESIATGGGQTVESNSIIPTGFTGTITIQVSGGAVLVVDGVVVGATAQVRAGSEVSLRGTSTASGSGSYGVLINGVSSTWTITTRPPVQPTPVAGTVSGYTPVSASVGENGAANISIPITVPPGTAGMEPKLAITYSSQAPNGLLGVGFSISGLFAIGRSGPTQWHDGKRSGVSLTENTATNESADRFTLDGQRLVITSGTWGAPGSTYRTEIDTFSRITALGDTNAGPLSWKVETKAGLTYEYGATADSRAIANRASVPGDDAVLSWSVNRITDNAGNSMEFLYYPLESGESGHSRIHRIRYTRNAAAGLVPLSQVVFFYEDRPDVQRSYAAGAKVEVRKRLQRADAMFGAECVRRYSLQYDLGVPSGLSQLRSITETAVTDGTSWPPTMVDWQNNEAIAVFGGPLNTGVPSYAATYVNDEAADFTGDGLTDLLIFNTLTEVGRRQFFDLYISKGDGTFQTPIRTTVNGYNSRDPGSLSRTSLGDFNADGKMDVVALDYTDNKYYLWFANGAGFDAQVLTAIKPYGGSATPIVTGDFDGDGRTDLLNYELNSSVDPIAKYYLFRSTGTSLVRTDVRIATMANGYPTLPGDYNGDGLTDLLVWGTPVVNNRYNLFLSTGEGFAPAEATDILSWDNTLTQNTLGDFNGDGLSDPLIWNVPGEDERFHLYVCTGKGFLPSRNTVVTSTRESNLLRQVTNDFTGDGIMDMVTWDTSISRYRLFRCDGNSGFNAGINTQIQAGPYGKATNLVGDFNGDGRSDVVAYRSQPDSGTYNIYLSQGVQPGLVSKVTTGHGGYTKFDYKPLTDPSVYTKGTGAVYPCYDMQASLHVVSSITTRTGADSDPFYPWPNPTPGELRTSYLYEQGWMCLDGRGFRGFKVISSTQHRVPSDKNIVSRTEYETENPVLAGRPTREIVTLGDGRKISETTNHWTPVVTTSYTPSGAAKAQQAFFVYADSSESKEFEINGQAGTDPPAVKTTSVSGVLYDTYGNLKHSLTEYGGGGFSEEVSSNYDNDTTKWWLGRLRDTTVTQRAPGQPDQTRSSTFEYSSVNGQVNKETIVTNTTALNLEKTYEFDGFGNIRQSTLKDLGTGETRTTITRYTPDGRFSEETENALGQIESKTYDPLTGNTKTQTGPNGLTTTWEYDAFGRPEKEIRSDGTTSITQYLRCTPGVAGAPPRAVHCVRTQSAGGGVKMVYFDILDREIRQDATSFDGQMVSVHNIYNPSGQISHVSVPFFSNESVLAPSESDYTYSFYDPIGRLFMQTAPGNRSTITNFNGLTATVTNPLNQTFTTQQDVRGRTGTATSYGSDAIANIHDPYGNLLEVRDGLGRTTTMRYDARGNKYEMREPNSGLTTYGYNAFGELTRQTDARGITVRLFYDKLGRLERREEPEGTTIWEYDTAPNGIGKLARVSRSADGYEEVYRYDAQGRPVETLTRIGSMRFVTGTTYDEYSRPRLTIYPTGFAVRNVYNAQGFLSEVLDAASGFQHWKAELINARGQVEEESYGNGLTGRRIYYAETGLVKDMQAGVRPGAIGTAFNSMRQSLTVEWDNIGNLKMRQDLMRPGSREDFGYDTRNRLETITGDGSQAMSMTYETDGRIKTKALTSLVAGESYNWTYDYLDPAHPHAVTRVRNTTGGATVRNLGYDAAGNALTDGDVALTYTSNNQPATIRKGNTTLAFSYGPGRARYRQVETTPTGQTTKLYIGGLYEREDTAGSTVHTHFIAGGSGVIAIRTITESVAGKSEKLRYLHRDHLGSLHTITRYEAPGSPDAALNGTVDEVLNFDAWGKRRTLEFNSATSSFRWTYATAPSQTDRGFTGHEMLDAVGLVHMNGRIYDPTLGRFLSVDPIVQEAGNLQNLNRYSYVLNNPLSMTDPSGFGFLKFLKKHWRTIAAVGVGILTGGAAVWAFAPAGVGFGTALATMVGASTGFSLTAFGAIAAGAGFGFGSAFSGTLLAGGSVGDALRAGLSGGAIGGLSAGLAHGVGVAFGHSTTSANWLEKVIAHGTSGGLVSRLGGGDFIHGFYAGAFTAGISPITSSIFKGAAVAAIADGIVGGTAAALGGGKFANGAMTGAFIRMFNSGAAADAGGMWDVDIPDSRTAINAIKAFGRGLLRRVPAIALATMLANPPELDFVYRVYGGKVEAQGHYWSLLDPRTVPNYAENAGLPQSNPGTHLAIGTVQNLSDKVATGAARIDWAYPAQPAVGGGVPQVFFQNKHDVRIMSRDELHPPLGWK